MVKNTDWFWDTQKDDRIWNSRNAVLACVAFIWLNYHSSVLNSLCCTESVSQWIIQPVHSNSEVKQAVVLWVSHWTVHDLFRSIPYPVMLTYLIESTTVCELSSLSGFIVFIKHVNEKYLINLLRLLRFWNADSDVHFTIPRGYRWLDVMWMAVNQCNSNYRSHNCKNTADAVHPNHGQYIQIRSCYTLHRKHIFNRSKFQTSKYSMYSI